MQQWAQGLRQGIGGARGQGKVWIREAEHFMLRVVSLAFSLASAHAIRWLLSPLDGVDVLQVYITWAVAIGFGILGFFLSRGLAHRMMNKEKIWAYLPICIVVEFFEIFCNFCLAASVISRATWLNEVPHAQRQVLEVLVYIALSIVPLVSMLLAVVDMDLARQKQPGGAKPKAVNPSAWHQQQPAAQGGYAQGYNGNGWQQQPAKQAAGGSANGATPLAGVASN
jgi:hypothetical protein